MVNKVILIGNVGKQPEIRYIDKTPVASFTLATTERAYTTRAGVNIPERTEWHNIVVFGSSAEVVEKYVTKGVRLYVEGKLRTRSWEDRNAIKRYVTEIYADDFQILSYPKNEQQQN